VSPRKLSLGLVLALVLSACAQTAPFLPMPDAGGAMKEAAAQNALSSKYRGSLGDRLRQLGTDEASDAERRARIEPVAARLFAAAAPFCRAPATKIGTGGGACTHPIVFENGDGLNAHANSRRISITRAMVDLTASDDQLALVLAHELAHVLLGHTRRGMWDRVAANFDESVEKTDERHADYLGLYLAARAGYDAREATNLWRRMGAVLPSIIHGDHVHPGTAERFVALRRAADEIEYKRRRGLPLVPGR